MSLLGEIRRRKVFQVAAVYAVMAWLIAQVIDVLNDPLSLPIWFDTVVVLLLAVGFPIAIVVAWAFDITPEGVTRTTGGDFSVAGGSRRLEYALLGLIIVGIGWLVVRDSISLDGDSNSVGSTPVVVLMDTSAPHGVYDQDTRDNSGTNADVLNDVLRDLPLVLNKEAIGSAWAREDQILKQGPDLILIHRSGFFHAMNLELGFGYSDEPATYDEEKWEQLYEFADNKLMAFLGFIGQGSAKTVFLVYSRGTGGLWTDDEYRANWVTRLEGRFPSLSGRITAIVVPGGTGGGTFRDPDTAQLIRQQVRTLLDIETES